jgi:hypothetical protein
MSRERIEMIQDAVFLLECALRDEHVTGPLSLPLTGIPVRE